MVTIQKAEWFVPQWYHRNTPANMILGVTKKGIYECPWVGDADRVCIVFSSIAKNGVLPLYDNSNADKLLNLLFGDGKLNE